MVEHGENLSLHLYVRKLLCAEQVFVHNLKCEISAFVVTEAAEENAAEIACPEVTEELQVAEVEFSVRGEIGGGFNGGPMRVGCPVGPEIDGGACGG